MMKCQLTSILGTMALVCCMLRLGSCQDASITSSNENTLTSVIKDLWHLYVLPAPYAVALIGQLILLSSRTSVSLNDNPPLDGFRYVRHPSSLKATIAQISNEAWDCLHQGYAATDTLQSETRQISRHFASLNRMVKEVNDSRLQQMTRNSIKVIRIKGNRCGQQASQTHAKFLGLKSTTDETISALHAAHSHTEDKLQTSHVQGNITDKKLNSYRRTESVLRAEETRAADELRRDEQALAEAIRNKNAANSFGMILLRTLTFFLGGSSRQSGVDFVSVNTPSKSSSGPARLDAILNDFEFSETTEILSRFETGLRNISSGHYPGNPRHYIKHICTKLQAIESGLSTAGKQTPLGRVIHDALNTTLPLLHTSGILSPNNIQLVRDKIESLGIRLRGASTKTNARATATSRVDVSNNEDFKVHHAQRLRQVSSKHQELIIQQRWIAMDQIRDLVGQMAKLKFEGAYQARALDLIKKSLSVLSLLNEQWASLTDFFSRMSVEVDTMVRVLLEPYLQKLSDSEEDANYFRTILTTEAADLENSLEFVHFIAKTCSTTFRQHVSQRITGLVHLDASDPRDHDRIRLDLENYAKDAEQQMKEAIERESEAFFAAVRARVPGDTEAGNLSV